MGRRSVPLSDQSRWVFNRLARAYLARPDYPVALVERVAALAGGAGARVADLGAGTGHLALPLVARGIHVTAVEPAREMLSALRERLAGEHPVQDATAARLDLVHATAESTGLPAAAFDLVLVADALHWVDPERAGEEAARIVAPSGAVALVEATPAATRFMDGLGALLARENPKARPRPPGAGDHFLALAAGGPVTKESFVQDVALDEPALEALLRSLSYAGPALAPAALDRLLDDARVLAAVTGGARLTRDLTLRWAARRVRGRA